MISNEPQAEEAGSADDAELDRLIAIGVQAAEKKARRETLERTRASRRRRLQLPAPAGWKRSFAAMCADADPELRSEQARLEVSFWGLVAERHPDNPLFPWQAFHLALEAGCPLPESVALYFRNAADQLFRKGAQPKERTAAAVLDALGFAGAGGGPTAWRRFETWERYLEWWREGQCIRGQIAEGTCPSCGGSGRQDGKRCEPCRGSGKWVRCTPKKSANAILAEIHGVAEETVKKARCLVSEIMKESI